MTKGSVVFKKQEPPAIVIDTVENDDWMKSLPGYKKEIELHERLARDLKKMRSKKKKL